MLITLIGKDVEASRGHLQVVYGVEPPAPPAPPAAAPSREDWLLLMLNPPSEEPAERVMRALATPPFMVIPR